MTGRILVAMSGGVDSSVAAAVLQEQGHEVVGVTMKLWGGESDSGCCSVSDVDDARRVADRLGIEHHARIGPGPDGRSHLRRGADAAKDQSYVLYVVAGEVLDRVSFPIGHLTKAQVRAEATRLGLRTASKPDSQDVCFITSTQGRAGFLAGRIPSTPGRVVDTSGRELGRVDAVELVTIGQRRGLDLGGNPTPRYAVDVDVVGATVTVGDEAALRTTSVSLESMVWAHDPVRDRVLVQSSAHGTARPATVTPTSAGADVRFDEPQRRIAPGQSVVLYAGDLVVGGGIARRP